MGMNAVGVQPVLDRVGTALAVRAGPPPLLLAETAQDGGRRRPCRLESGQRWRNRTVGVEIAHERLLVVPEESRRVLRDQQSQPDSRGHLAVGQVVNDLPRAPLARRLARLQLRVGDSLQCRRYGPEAVLVLIDQRLTLRRVHPSPSARRVLLAVLHPPFCKLDAAPGRVEPDHPQIAEFGRRLEVAGPTTYEREVSSYREDLVAEDPGSGLVFALEPA